MRLARLALFCPVAVVTLVSANGSESISANAIIREINIVRQNPALYATYVEELRAHYDRGFVVFPGGARWRRLTKGLGAVDEAVRFLRAARPELPLTMSPGMCRAAAQHCADQAAGRTGHRGSDGSNPGDRLGRYGVWSGLWGENIAYGKTTAREIVLAFIIDDGRPARPHRKNILNPSFHYAGVACGRHTRYGSVCAIDFATGYNERPARGAHRKTPRYFQMATSHLHRASLIIPLLAWQNP